MRERERERGERFIINYFGLTLVLVFGLVFILVSVFLSRVIKGVMQQASCPAPYVITSSLTLFSLHYTA